MGNMKKLAQQSGYDFLNKKQKRKSVGLINPNRLSAKDEHNSHHRSS
jgi:hypothetical protein